MAPLLGSMDMVIGETLVAGCAAGALLAAGAGSGGEAAGTADAEEGGIDDGVADAAALVSASGFCDPPQAKLAVMIAATEQTRDARFKTELMISFPL